MTVGRVGIGLVASFAALGLAACGAPRHSGSAGAVQTQASAPVSAPAASPTAGSYDPGVDQELNSVGGGLDNSGSDLSQAGTELNTQENP